MSSLSLAQRLTKEHVQLEPFPHLVVEQALPQAICRKLTEEYMTLRAIDQHKNNHRFDVTLPQVRHNRHVTPLWNDFLEYHNSEQFCRDLLHIFEDVISLRFPELATVPEDIDHIRIGQKGIDDEADDCRLFTAAYISGNTPVLNASSVRPCHIDHPNKLVSGLYYLRDDEDDSVGGDLEICRPVGRWKFTNHVYVEDSQREVVKTVKYKSNTLVVFINSLTSWHGVTPRQPTPYMRKFLNIVCEARDPLFDVSPHQDRWDVVMRGLKLRRYQMVRDNRVL